MQNPNHAGATRLSLVQRKPKRISITLPFHVWNTLVEDSDIQGRSVSNLAAYVIELGLAQNKAALGRDTSNQWKQTG